MNASLAPAAVSMRRDGGRETFASHFSYDAPLRRIRSALCSVSSYFLLDS
jgi:hypothetical protein